MNHGPGRVRVLRWRDDRVDHIGRHGISWEEVEEAVFGDQDGLLLRGGAARRDPAEALYRYLGRTEAGRHLLVVLLYLGEGMALPVTARDMSAAERRRFNDRRPRSR